MKLPSLSFLAQAFGTALRRFPATMLCAFAGTAMLMMIIENSGDKSDLAKIWPMAQIGLALCTGLTVFAESKRWNWQRQAGLQLIGIGLLVIYYFQFGLDDPLLETLHLPRYMALLATAHLFAAMAPYLNRLSVSDFWEYNKQLFANFVVGAAYTLILFAGLAVALLAVNELFDLNIEGKMYGHLFVLLAGIFNTTFFLYHMPRSFTFEGSEKAYNVVFKNLCQYILIPIVSLYFLILYAYSVKILVTWTLPRGWVASLVLGFSVAGIFTYLINYLLPDYSDNKVVHAYRRWFWWVLLPMVGLLFVSISRRIGDYGVTEERFFVAHAGVWLLVMCAYFLWSKTDNIKFIPISLALFILVAVLGPMSAFEVAKRSQTAILHRMLEESGRFEGGKLKPGGEPVTGAQAERIVSCLDFLERREALPNIEGWFPIPLQAIPDAPGPGATSKASKLAAWLNVESYASPTPWKQMISIMTQGPAYQTPISGFRTYYRLELYGTQPSYSKANTYIIFNDNQTAILVKDGIGSAVLDSFDLRPKMEAWKKSAEKDALNLPAGEETFELRGRKYTARFVLEGAYFNGTDLKMENMHGMMFLK